DPGGIPSRAVEGGNKPNLNRIVAAGEDNGNCRGRRLSRESCNSTSGGNDDAESTSNKVRRQIRQSIVSTFRRSIFDQHVLTLDVAQLAEALPESDNQLRGNNRTA